MRRSQQCRAEWVSAARRVLDGSPVGRLACRQAFVVTPAQARAAGMDPAELRRRVRRHEWTATRRGVLSVLAPTLGNRPEILAAAGALVRPDATISHECAALARGLDVLHTPAVATLSTPYRSHACSRSGAVVRAAVLQADEVTHWFGAPLTTVARTVVDIARRGASDGIVVADSALREGLVTHAQLRAVLARQSRWDGVVTARQVVELATPKSESPLESLARLFMATHGIALPEQQVRIHTARGAYRVDGLWAHRAVVFEADGLGKYRDDGSGQDNPLVREKLRQEALEQAGYTVVRVTWADIHLRPHETAARIRRALAP